MASGIFVVHTVADDAELPVSVVLNIPGRVSAAGIHAEVPFGVGHLPCYYSQCIDFLWICECNGFTKEAAVMQQDGIAEDEENCGT
jgi:hypothetical protein